MLSFLNAKSRTYYQLQGTLASGAYIIDLIELVCEEYSEVTFKGQLDTYPSSRRGFNNCDHAQLKGNVWIGTEGQKMTQGITVTIGGCKTPLSFVEPIKLQFIPDEWRDYYKGSAYLYCWRRRSASTGASSNVFLLMPERLDTVPVKDLLVVLQTYSVWCESEDHFNNELNRVRQKCLTASLVFRSFSCMRANTVFSREMSKREIQTIGHRLYLDWMAALNTEVQAVGKVPTDAEKRRLFMDAFATAAPKFELMGTACEVISDGLIGQAMYNCLTNLSGAMRRLHRDMKNITGGIRAMNPKQMYQNASNIRKTIMSFLADSQLTVDYGIKAPLRDYETNLGAQIKQFKQLWTSPGWPSTMIHTDTDAVVRSRFNWDISTTCGCYLDFTELPTWVQSMELWYRSGLCGSTLTKAWDIIPLSFVVDWFYNVGEIISDMQASLDARRVPIDFAWYSRKLKSSFEANIGSGVTGSVEMIYYRRRETSAPILGLNDVYLEAIDHLPSRTLSGFRTESSVSADNPFGLNARNWKDAASLVYKFLY